MELAFLFHFYQPIVQDEAMFRKVAEECYLPFAKFLRNRRGFRVTLNLPLSLLEQLDKYEYSTWIRDIKELVDSGRVEIVGSAAYHPLLTKLPKEFVEKQIILNEFGLGYYFGRRTGFEGEPAVLIKNLEGFWAPELAVSEELLGIIGDLGYTWMVVDEVAMSVDAKEEGAYGFYRLRDTDFRIVCRHRDLSNALAFKRSDNSSDILEAIGNLRKPCVVAMDGEFLGHHYKHGLTFFDHLLDDIGKMEVAVVSVGELVSKQEKFTEVDALVESSWGATDEDMKNGNIYPMWDKPGNKLHKLQWELLNLILSGGDSSDYKMLEGLGNKPIWKESVLNSIEDDNVRNGILLEWAKCRSMLSDFFWWASREVLPTDEVLYDQNMIERCLNLYEGFADFGASEDLILDIKKISDEIRSNLK